MTEPVLSFRSIEIRRMPGFPRRGFRVEDLCPGVNIIYGPNASGKTTLGRAIRRLLRPEDKSSDRRSSLVTILDLEGARIELDYDAGSVKCRSWPDRVDRPCPELAPAELGDRHVLALQDLIHSEEGSDLAAQIVKELAGGYDISAARTDLGYREGPSRKPKAAQEFNKAAGEYREAVRRQNALMDKEKSLDRLEDEKRAAEYAQVRLRAIEKALEHKAAEDRAEKIALELEEFPAGVSEVSERDVAELDRLNKSLGDHQLERDGQQDELDKAVRSKQDCGLPEEGIAAEVILTLRSKCQRLLGLADDISREEAAVAGLEAEAEQAREALGPDIDPQQAAQIDTAWVEDQLRFAHRAESLRAEQSAADAMKEWLGAEDPSEATDSLHEGILLLRRWLGAEEEHGDRADAIALAAIVGGGLIGLLSLAMSFAAFHFSWIIALISSVAMVGWTLWQRRRPAVDRRIEFRREFESLGLDPPEEWSAADVSACLRRLQQSHAKVELDKERAVRWGDLGDRIARLAGARGKLDEEARARRKQLGVDLSADPAGLAVAASNINRYQQARQKEEAARASLEEARHDHASVLDEINAAVSPYGNESVTNVDTASARVENLDNLRQRHDSAVQTAGQCERMLKGLDAKIEEENGQVAAIFERVDLKPDEEHELRRLAKLRQKYDALDEDLRVARRASDSAETALKDHPDLLKMSADELTDHRREVSATAERLSAVSREIGGIESEIDAAKRANDLEAILARREEALDVWRLKREDDYRAVAGYALADFISRQQREDEQPRVLRRARQLFTRITQGRYELHVHEADPPQFRALDTAENRGLTLDELSSGTRLQLLLAARVAFVEEQERGLQVPLILDETLGNSDELRAGEIIDAIIEICRLGRQVFYFTAQHDEVGKWRRLLRASGQVEHHEVDLAAVREFSEKERVPPVEFDSPAPVSIPPPQGRSWSEYGRALKAPALDPEEESGNYHLWYLIEDPEALYRLLKNGVNRWGQLQSLVSHGQAEDIGRDSEVFRRAQASVRVLEEAARQWRIGRGAPVDRGVLIDSGAVSGRFIDQVSKLAADHSGDARQLIAALESGQVKGFRKASREILQEYLGTQGHLDERDTLTADEIRDNVRPIVFSDMENGLIDAAGFERLVSMVADRRPAKEEKSDDR